MKILITGLLSEYAGKPAYQAYELDCPRCLDRASVYIGVVVITKNEVCMLDDSVQLKRVYLRSMRAVSNQSFWAFAENFEPGRF